MGKQTKLFSYNLLISIFFPSSIADKGKESKHMLKIELFNPNCLGGWGGYCLSHEKYKICKHG